jgi:hypothetical protein
MEEWLHKSTSASHVGRFAPEGRVPPPPGIHWVAPLTGLHDVESRTFPELELRPLGDRDRRQRTQKCRVLPLHVEIAPLAHESVAFRRDMTAGLCSIEQHVK